MSEGGSGVVADRSAHRASTLGRWWIVLLRAVIYAVTLGYGVSWFVLTHTPLPPGFGANLLGDKLAHYLGYGALTGLMYMALWVTWPAKRWIVLLAFPMGLAYGAVDEVTQPFFGRTCELRDWLADAAGAGTAVLGWELIRMTRRLFEKRRGE